MSAAANISSHINAILLIDLLKAFGSFDAGVFSTIERISVNLLLKSSFSNTHTGTELSIPSQG